MAQKTIEVEVTISRWRRWLVLGVAWVIGPFCLLLPVSTQERIVKGLADFVGRSVGIKL